MHVVAQPILNSVFAPPAGTAGGKQSCEVWDSDIECVRTMATELRNGKSEQFECDVVSSDPLTRIAEAIEHLQHQIDRIADHFDPPPSDKVGTPYIAECIGCTTVWITEMVRNGEIPPDSVVPGTGNGKPWKFFRARIDEWLQSR